MSTPTPASSAAPGKSAPSSGTSSGASFVLPKERQQALLSHLRKQREKARAQTNTTTTGTTATLPSAPHAKSVQPASDDHIESESEIPRCSSSSSSPQSGGEFPCRYAPPAPPRSSGAGRDEDAAEKEYRDTEEAEVEDEEDILETSADTSDEAGDDDDDETHDDGRRRFLTDSVEYNPTPLPPNSAFSSSPPAGPTHWDLRRESLSSISFLSSAASPRSPLSASMSHAGAFASAHLGAAEMTSHSTSNTSRVHHSAMSPLHSPLSTSSSSSSSSWSTSRRFGGEHPDDALSLRSVGRTEITHDAIPYALHPRCPLTREELLSQLGRSASIQSFCPLCESAGARVPLGLHPAPESARAAQDLLTTRSQQQYESELSRVAADRERRPSTSVASSTSSSGAHASGMIHQSRASFSLAAGGHEYARPTEEATLSSARARAQAATATTPILSPHLPTTRTGSFSLPHTTRRASISSVSLPDDSPLSRPGLSRDSSASRAASPPAQQQQQQQARASPHLGPQRAEEENQWWKAVEDAI